MSDGYSGYNAPTDFNSDGGFLQGSSGSQGNSSGSSMDSKKNLTPCTIKQLVDAAPELQDGVSSVGNLNLSNVSVVGVVRTVTDNDSFLLLNIEDGTGQLEFRLYKNSNSSSTGADADGDDGMGGYGDDPMDSGSLEKSAGAEYSVGEYIKVYATPRSISGRLGLQYVVVHKIKSYNEVLEHLLSAAKVYLVSEGRLDANGHKLEGGSSSSSSSSAAALSSGNNTKSENKGLFVQDDDQTPGQRIITLLHDSKGSFPNGTPLRFISEKLNMSIDAVRDTTQNFIDEGLCYTTLEDHVELT